MKELQDIYDGKNVVVTGATGLVGQALVPHLLEWGANVTALGMSPPIKTWAGYDDSHPNVTYKQVDLCFPGSITEFMPTADYLFHLAGIKGSTAVGRSKGHAFFTKTLLMNTHVLEAACQWEVPLLYTSSIAVYPASCHRMSEDDMWSGQPHKADWFAAHAKRAGEVQLAAMREAGWCDHVIVRPANIFGPYDNFDPETGMVVSALIHRAQSGESPLKVWGDGSAVRDFIYAGDVARGMLLAMGGPKPAVYNLGSGSETSIKELVRRMGQERDEFPPVEWIDTAQTGQPYKVLDSTKAHAELGWEAGWELQNALTYTWNWYKHHKNVQRHDPLKGSYRAD